MKGECEVTVNHQARILEIRMRGIFDSATILAAVGKMRECIDSLEGRRHITVADMRGMKTMHPTIAEKMGELIGYQRRRGCVLCIHVSDETVQRLQVARIARQYSPDDDLTVEVSTIEEARVLSRRYVPFLDDERFAHSIRTAVPLSEPPQAASA